MDRRCTPHGAVLRTEPHGRKGAPMASVSSTSSPSPGVNLRRRRWLGLRSEGCDVAERPPQYRPASDLRGLRQHGVAGWHFGGGLATDARRASSRSERQLAHARVRHLRRGTVQLLERARLASVGHRARAHHHDTPRRLRDLGLFVQRDARAHDGVGLLFGARQWCRRASEPSEVQWLASLRRWVCF